MKTLIEELDDMADQQSAPGKYIGVKFSPETVINLTEFCEENSIPNAINPEKFHSTVLYSRKPLPDLEARGEYETPMFGTLTGFDIWQSTPDEGEPTNCLVLTYDCAALSEYHDHLSSTYDVPFDFEGGYKPHVTLSYNVGDLDISDLELPDWQIEIVYEYEEELNTNWAADEG